MYQYCKKSSRKVQKSKNIVMLVTILLLDVPNRCSENEQMVESVKGCISVLSEKLRAISTNGRNDVTSTKREVVLDLNHPKVDKTAAKVGKAVFECSLYLLVHSENGQDVSPFATSLRRRRVIACSRLIPIDRLSFQAIVLLMDTVKDIFCNAKELHDVAWLDDLLTVVTETSTSLCQALYLQTHQWLHSQVWVVKTYCSTTVYLKRSRAHQQPSSRLSIPILCFRAVSCQNTRSPLWPLSPCRSCETTTAK